MIKILKLFPPLALLVTGGVTVLSTLSETPAFNANLRQSNIFGQDVLRFSAPMYAQSAYLFQIGTSYLRADLVLSAQTGGASDYASSEVALSRAETAADLFKKSLALAPAEAHVWSSLAWAYTLSGDADSARIALKNSWDLAPHNRQLADWRVGLADALYFPDIPEIKIDLSEAEQVALMRDLEILRIYDPETYEVYAQ